MIGTESEAPGNATNVEMSKLQHSMTDTRQTVIEEEKDSWISVMGKE